MIHTAVWRQELTTRADHKSCRMDCSVRLLLHAPSATTTPGGSAAAGSSTQQLLSTPGLSALLLLHSCCSVQVVFRICSPLAAPLQGLLQVIWLRSARTLMGEPVASTRCPRTRPSVPSMAMQRTLLSPMC